MKLEIALVIMCAACEAHTTAPPPVAQQRQIQFVEAPTPPQPTVGYIEPERKEKYFLTWDGKRETEEEHCERLKTELAQTDEKIRAVPESKCEQVHVSRVVRMYNGDEYSTAPHVETLCDDNLGERTRLGQYRWSVSRKYREDCVHAAK